MIEKSRQRMIAGINSVSGRSDCAEAVVLQQRSRAAVVGLLIAFAILMTVIRRTIDPGSLLSGGIAGLVVGLGMTFLTTTYWLGYCDGDILLVKTNRMQNKPEEVTAQYTYPVAMTVSGGLLTKKVQVAGIDYVMARQFEDRLRSVTGS
jgi:hypothetical protein